MFRSQRNPWYKTKVLVAEHIFVCFKWGCHLKKNTHKINCTLVLAMEVQQAQQTAVCHFQHKRTHKSYQLKAANCGWKRSSFPFLPQNGFVTPDTKECKNKVGNIVKSFTRTLHGSPRKFRLLRVYHERYSRRSCSFFMLRYFIFSV